MGYKTRVKGSAAQIGNVYKEEQRETQFGARRKASGSAQVPVSRSVDSMKAPVRGASMKAGNCQICGKYSSVLYPDPLETHTVGLCHSCAKDRADGKQKFADPTEPKDQPPLTIIGKGEDWVDWRRGDGKNGMLEFRAWKGVTPYYAELHELPVGTKFRVLGNHVIPAGDVGKANRLDSNAPRVTLVRIYRAEGSTDDPTVGHWMDFKTIEEADAQLNKNRRTAPEGGGYHKHDVIVAFSDATVWKTRYDLTREEPADIERHVQNEASFYAKSSKKKLPWVSDRDRAGAKHVSELLEKKQPRKVPRDYRPRKVRSRAQTEKSAQRFRKLNKPTHPTVESLKAERDELWHRQKTIEETEKDPAVARARTDALWRGWKDKQPNMQPLVYKTSIGHYGGLHVYVPEEKMAEFKSHFPGKEFPRSVAEVHDMPSRGDFKQRFPNSQKAYKVFFADRSKGEQRLDYMTMPVPE